MLHALPMLCMLIVVLKRKYLYIFSFKIFLMHITCVQERALFFVEIAQKCRSN